MTYTLLQIDSRWFAELRQEGFPPLLIDNKRGDGFENADDAVAAVEWVIKRAKRTAKKVRVTK